MRSSIRHEILRRLRDRALHATFWPGLIAIVAYVILGINENTSTGAGLWLPAVVVPALAGGLWTTAGVRWILTGSRRGEADRCGRCGYDLRHRPAPDAPCPECGAVATAATCPPTWIRVTTQLPGVLLLLIGVLCLMLATLYAILIDAGAFDI